MTLLYVQNFQTLRIIIARNLYRICFQGITVIYGLFVIFSILIFFFSEKLKKMKLISIKTVFLRVVLQLYRMWFVLTRIINSFRLKDDEMYQVLVQFCVTLSFRLLTRCVRIQIKRKKKSPSSFYRWLLCRCDTTPKWCSVERSGDQPRQNIHVFQRAKNKIFTVLLKPVRSCEISSLWLHLNVDQKKNHFEITFMTDKVKKWE